MTNNETVNVINVKSLILRFQHVFNALKHLYTDQVEESTLQIYDKFLSIYNDKIENCSKYDDHTIIDIWLSYKDIANVSLI